MNDKVDVEIIVPEIEEKYNVLLPINKRIGTIVNLLNKHKSSPIEYEGTFL